MQWHQELPSYTTFILSAFLNKDFEVNMHNNGFIMDSLDLCIISTLLSFVLILHCVLIAASFVSSVNASVFLLCVLHLFYL